MKVLLLTFSLLLVAGSCENKNDSNGSTDAGTSDPPPNTVSPEPSKQDADEVQADDGEVTTTEEPEIDEVPRRDPHPVPLPDPIE